MEGAGRSHSGDKEEHKRSKLLLDFLSFSTSSFSSMARYSVVTDKVSMEVVKEFILERLNLTKGIISKIKDNLETLLQEDIQADLVCCLQHLQLRFETEDKARRLLSNVSFLLKPGGYFFGITPEKVIAQNYCF
ncbi:mRNA cap guanine-N7 methyltransferase-like isoform X1 [Gossypium raimondii]|uniref:mRNA cap guanine-N7 methyltransferase-like isoform X1 n=1 Tax=Gossypium raimondii TaxID=29730 RepID=UPI00063AB49F|nr:mRNA cap guanine-N7 methyltransferase-like isoform X1 [Gossypium raimondii]